MAKREAREARNADLVKSYHPRVANRAIGNGKTSPL
jgi:hypothetical protein